MSEYAQTNIQLYNQLRSAGYSNEEVVLIHKSYELAMRLFTGMFRPCGKPFLNHLVRTASILSSLGANSPVVAAALLHAAYAQADFGTNEKGMTDEKRKYLRQAVGDEVEDYVARYTALKWRVDLIPRVYAAIDTLDAIDRQVVLMRVVNQFENLLDFGILFHHDAESRIKALERSATGLVQIANKLAAHSLAIELEKISGEIFSLQIPVNLRSTVIQNKRYYIKPLSDP